MRTGRRKRGRLSRRVRVDCDYVVNDFAENSDGPARTQLPPTFTLWKSNGSVRTILRHRSEHQSGQRP
ncbi:hypothetical protein HZH68_007500 [Vespula germanica]|uniref:Uncharacterized protein n=2 Tax=Vespula TaxID=7451 RepID=A0A834K883_VESGE|nr:hypothetical protein HZH68_007500 [Vespula germanica]KAF7425640.1 hypothetical protein H0235_008078 [Vespula pensylvanica]